MNKLQAKARLVDLYLEQSRIERDIAEMEHIINPRKRSVAACGTDSGYYRHVRTLKQKPCLACRNAHADYERNRAARSLKAAS